MGEWPGSVTSYRLYCQGCDAETVVREADLEATAWRVTSLHFHEGECPECVSAAAESDDGAVEGAVADGGQPTLEAFAEGDDAGGGQ